MLRRTGSTYSTTPIAMNLGSHLDYFDVNNASAVVISPDGEYAFVTGYNRYIQGVLSHDPNENPNNPAGGNIGIIKDPLGPAPKLVGATRPIPMSWPDNLTLSPDGKVLYAAYRGNNFVMAFDVDQMIATVNDANFASKLETTPVDDLNPAIDLRANYKMIKPGIGWSDPVFGVPTGATNGPIATGGLPQGLESLGGLSLTLLTPIGSESDLTPEFTWKLEPPSGVTNLTAKIYVSTFGNGDGLFPTDLSDIHGHPGRIVDGVLVSGTAGAGGTLNFAYTLPNTGKLTAGQKYTWGVEIWSGNNMVARDWMPFSSAPVENGKPFGSVTVLTHGFQLNPAVDPNNLPSNLSSLASLPVLNNLFFNVQGGIAQFYEMAEYIARSGGDGVAAKYDKPSGKWLVFYDGVSGLQGIDLVTAALRPQMAGRPLVLLSDWYDESDTPDSGFSEAAADALFSALVKLNQGLSNNIFASPLHFIGHSRGTVVNSEIIQRLGTHVPTSLDIQMTSLDPHDFNQPSLDVFGILPWGDFKDPDVTRWENVAYADNYYHTLASMNALGLSSGVVMTPNGRAVSNADLNLKLNGLGGFTHDDGVLGQFPLRAGGPHSRVWRWYGGTTNLDVTEFDKGSGEIVYRRLIDINQAAIDGSGGFWYRPISLSTGTAPSEGIGTGWFLAPQGGGHPASSGAAGTPVNWSNTEVTNQSGLAVPTVFNGDFEYGNLHRTLRDLSFALPEVPGWSFHGGSFAMAFGAGGLLGLPTDRIVDAGNGNHAARLDKQNNVITHNRFYVPTDMKYLRLDTWVKDAADGDRIFVRGLNEDGSSFEIGHFSVDKKTESFVTHMLELPANMLAPGFNQANFRLQIELSSSALLGLSETWVDRIEFSKGLIEDSSGSASDKAVLFLDTTTAQPNQDHQFVKVHNPFQNAITVKLEADRSDFLVYLGAAGEQRFDTAPALVTLLNGVTIQPGQEIKVDLRADYLDAFARGFDLSDIPMTSSYLEFTIDTGTSTLTENVDLFYMADFADAAARTTAFLDEGDRLGVEADALAARLAEPAALGRLRGGSS